MSDNLRSVSEFSHDGLRVRVRRKAMKNVRMRVVESDVDVEVSAPFGVNDERIRYFIDMKAAWIENQRRSLADSPQSRASCASKQEIERWRETVMACVPPLIEAWEPIMGVKVGRLVYRNMTSRWGSCQPATGRVCINIRLALYPPECLEYVVVHELCHLLEAGHGPGFKEKMDFFMPDWRERRAKLR